MFGKRSDTDVFKKIKMDKTRSTSEILSFFESRLDSIFDNSKVLKNDDVSLTTEGIIRDSSKLLSMTIRIYVEVEELDARINLKDTTDEINKKIKKAKSDSEPIPDDLKSLEKKPEALNLLTIYSEVSKNSMETVLNEMAGKEYSFLKTKLAEMLINEITPIGKEIKKLLDDKSHLKAILKEGSEKANIIAEENIKNIRDKVGLV